MELICRMGVRKDSQGMGKYNQPTGKVRELARRMYVEQPFLPQIAIAEVLGVSKGRIAQLCADLEEDRKHAQKSELAKLKAHYSTEDK
ncbi:MAG TPA: hypothetical protein VMP68_22685 [Candidatus Eisenbacteria bacterium]|nr:hypothetical protein [Candidatus Eisenbacteria bacterium]